jgi:outer membrane murein-binding lipoprotein Lpp
MKTLSIAFVCSGILALSGCSRSTKPEASKVQEPTVPKEQLQSDAARLQQATANAAKEREKREQSTPSPTANP